MSKRRFISFDWAMKKLLRSKANFEILEGFLGELLKDNIHILEILESESNKENSRDKFNRVDLKVKNQKNEIIIIEVQYEREFDYLQRILFGTSKVITEHLRESEPYSEIVKVISVNILYFDLGQGEDYIYYGATSFKGLHNHDLLELSDDQQELYKKNKIHQIFPEYYLIKVNSFNDIAKDTLDEWIYFLKNEEIKENFIAKGLIKAKQELDILKLPEQERIAYEKYQEDLHYQASMVESSYTIGVKKGVKQGIEQGIEQGEKRKAIEIAKKLIDVLDTKTIAAKTGLSEQDIEILRQ
jgi:predicted transposase/invertase (TIGR01784 family)